MLVRGFASWSSTADRTRGSRARPPPAPKAAECLTHGEALAGEWGVDVVRDGKTVVTAGPPELGESGVESAPPAPDRLHVRATPGNRLVDA